MTPHLEILPIAQRLLWPQLADIPKNFILYGGTAVALQLGHRESVDFDFFSLTPLDRYHLLDCLPILKKCQLTQPDPNTLNCFLQLAEGEIKLQFLANLGSRQGQMFEALKCSDNGLQVATLADLAATKLNTIQMRAQLKDYLDLYAIFKNGLTLAECLGYAKAIYGINFDPATSLKALCSYHEGDLEDTPSEVKKALTHLASTVTDIPKFIPLTAPRQ